MKATVMKRELLPLFLAKIHICILRIFGIFKPPAAREIITRCGSSASFTKRSFAAIFSPAYMVWTDLSLYDFYSFPLT